MTKKGNFTNQDPTCFEFLIAMSFPFACLQDKLLLLFKIISLSLPKGWSYVETNS